MATLTLDRLESLIAGFAEAVDEPSEALPAVRCISDRSLRKVLASLRRIPEFRWLRNITNATAVGSLRDANLLVPVGDHQDATIAAADRLYAVGLSPDPDDLDPLEILTALEPHGIVCYFTAYVLHDLTTQVPAIHHVAIPTNRAVSAEREPPNAKNGSDEIPPSLGTLRYTIGRTRFFSTQRARQLVPGVESRQMHPGLRIRCTTLEQTLLDGLLRPFSCGGPAVVLEGWERGGERMDHRRLADLLKAMRYPRLVPRTGYLLEAFGLHPELADSLHRQVEFDARSATDTLFPGLHSERIDRRWNLRVP